MARIGNAGALWVHTGAADRRNQSEFPRAAQPCTGVGCAGDSALFEAILAIFIRYVIQRDRLDYTLDISPTYQVLAICSVLAMLRLLFFS